MSSMLPEIGDRHFATGYKCSHAGKESQGNENAAPKLDDPCSQHQWRMDHGRPAEGAEQLLRAMAQKQQSRDDSQRGEGIRLQTTQRFHEIQPFRFSVVAAECTCEPSLLSRLALACGR